VSFRYDTQLTTFICNMGHQPNRSKLNAKAIEGLIEKNLLSPALDMLKDWAGATHSEIRKEIIILKGRLFEIKRQGRLEFIPFEEMLRCQSKVAHAILSLLEEIDSEDIY
jgi:hypothetical protein